MKQHILSEGNDIHVILQICTKHGLNRPKGFQSKKVFEQKFALKNKNGEPLGKDEVLGYVDEISKTADLQAFAIVIDADKSVPSTWQSACATLQKLGYTDLPAEIPKDGAIIVDADPDLAKVGVWIMPDNENRGEIEDFFLQMISLNDFYLQRAKASVKELILEEKNLFAASDRSKAEVHTWLAWQKDPGKSMGIAIKSNWIDHKFPLAERFARWFANVFELEN